MVVLKVSLAVAGYFFLCLGGAKAVGSKYSTPVVTHIVDSFFGLSTVGCHTYLFIHDVED